MPGTVGEITNKIIDLHDAPRYDDSVSRFYADSRMPHLIKRYDNRKLYDTDGKRYVSLREVAAMVRTGEEVSVVDNATGADLTAPTLAKVIVEESSEERPRLEPQFLHQVLRWGGRKMASGVEQFQEGLDRLIQASLERLAPIQEVRGEMNQLRERLAKLEKTIEDLEAGHGYDEPTAR